VDVNTIGAGGGSIAWIDAAGGLRVGPRSAGAEPGPACYARGGDEATVTDASVVLGYLNPARFADGAMTLDVAAAERAVAAIGRRLGVDPVAAAAGIHRVVNARMADQIRLVTIKRGYDPRQFSLVVLGGAGPVHGAACSPPSACSPPRSSTTTRARCRRAPTWPTSARSTAASPSSTPPAAGACARKACPRRRCA